MTVLDGTGEPLCPGVLKNITARRIRAVFLC